MATCKQRLQLLKQDSPTGDSTRECEPKPASALYFNIDQVIDGAFNAGFFAHFAFSCVLKRADINGMDIDKRSLPQLFRRIPFVQQEYTT